LYPFSLCEYLFFKFDKKVPRLTLEEIFDSKFSSEHLRFDYYIQYKDESIVVEVGGKSKGREQFKGITDKKKIIFSHSTIVDKIRRPLLLLGFLN